MKKVERVFKKAVSLFTASVMGLSLLSTGAFAADLIEGEATVDTVYDAVQTIADVRFAESGTIHNKDTNNFIIQVDDQKTFNDNPQDGYTQPAFFKFDLSNIDLSTMRGAYIVWGIGNQTTNLIMYDVPSDTLPEFARGAVVSSEKRITIDATKSIAGGKTNNSKITTENYSALPDGYNLGYDVTNYITQEKENGSQYATIMVATWWGGAYYMEKGGAKLYIKSNDMPTVSISVPETIKQGSNLVINAAVTDNNTIKDAKVYVDDKEVESTLSGKAISATVTDLEAGKHSIYVLVTDAYGATGDATASVFVRKEITEKEIKTVVSYTDVSNPNFALNLDYSGRTRDEVDKEGNKTTVPDRYNLVMDNSAGEGGSLTKVGAPIFFKFNVDINDMLDPDGDGVADYDLIDADLLMSSHSRDDVTLHFYDVTSNKVSVDSMKAEDGTITMPAISDEFAGIKIGAAKTKFTALSNAGNFDGVSVEELGSAFDIKDYIVSKNGDFSLMMYTPEWKGTVMYMGSVENDVSGTSKTPRLYLHLAEKPEVQIVSCEQEYTGEALTVNVEAKDAVKGIEKVEIYVDGVLKATVTEGKDNVYSTDISGLAFGTHKVKAVATALTGATSSSEMTAYVQAAGGTYTNLYRAVISTHKDSLKLTSLTKNATDPIGFMGFNKKDCAEVHYYQYNVMSLKDSVDEIESVKLKMNIGTPNGSRYDFNAVKSDYVFADNTTFDDLYALESNERTALGELATTSDGGDYEADITDAFKTVISDSSYGSLLTLRVNNRWANFSNRFSPIEIVVTTKDNSPKFVTVDSENSTMTIAVKPADYAEDGAESICVAAATYNEDGVLQSTDIQTIPVRDKYTFYTVPMSGTKYKVFVYDNLASLKPLLTAPVTNITE